MEVMPFNKKYIFVLQWQDKLLIKLIIETARGNYAVKTKKVKFKFVR